MEPELLEVKKLIDNDSLTFVKVIITITPVMEQIQYTVCVFIVDFNRNHVPYLALGHGGLNIAARQPSQ